MAAYRQFFEDYAKTYDSFDIKQMITYAHCPMITVQQGEAKIHATPEEVEGFFSQLLVWFRGIEHEHASISHLDVQPLGEKRLPKSFGEANEKVAIPIWNGLPRTTW